MPRTYGTSNFVPYTTEPPVGPQGDTYYNTTEKRAYVSDGVKWNTGSSTVAAGTADYKWSTDTTATDPGSGRIKVNNATASSATAVYASLYDQTGAVIRLDSLNIGDTFVIYRTGDITQSVKYQCSGQPTNNANSWFTIPVTYISSGSGGFSPGQNNLVQAQATAVPGGINEVTVAHQPAPTATSVELWVDLDTPQPMLMPSIPAFATVAARDAAWTTPYAGAMCVTIDTGTQWQYFATSGSWTAGWYKVFGRLGTYRFTSHAGPTTAYSIGALTIPTPPGRILKSKLHINLSGSATGVYAYARVDSVNQTSWRYFQANAFPGSPGGLALYGEVTHTPTAGSHTYDAAITAASNFEVWGDTDVTWFEVWDAGAA